MPKTLSVVLLLGLHTYSVRAFCFGCCICHLLSVCPTSDLGNCSRYAQNFTAVIGNQGCQVRI